GPVEQDVVVTGHGHGEPLPQGGQERLAGLGQQGDVGGTSAECCFGRTHARGAPARRSETFDFGGRLPNRSRIVRPAAMRNRDQVGTSGCRSGTLTVRAARLFAGRPHSDDRSNRVPIINSFSGAAAPPYTSQMPISPALEALDQRRSVPSMQLGGPGPYAATMLRMLQSGVRGPVPGRLVPCRCRRIAGDARHAVGEFLAARTQKRDPDAPAAAVGKDRLRFSRAPLVVAVIARLQSGHKVPEQEQLLTAGCACFALLQAAQALGFGAQWLTAWVAYDPEVTRLLGLG